MYDVVTQRIEQSPRFKELVARRGRFAWTLSAVMLGLYVAYILVIAFDPQLFGTRISADSSITWGMPAGLGLIFSAFILTGIYVRRANGEFDELTAEIIKEAQQ